MPVRRWNAVEAAAGVLDDLERLGQLAQRLDGLVVDALGTAVLGRGPVVVAHLATVRRGAG